MDFTASRHSTKMAAATLPSSSLYLQLSSRTRVRIGTLGPKTERWRHHREPRGAPTQLLRREISRRRLWFGRSMAHEDEVPRSHSVPLPPSLTDLAMDFYSSINEKDLSELHRLIADDCVLEDMTFSKPLKGKQIHHFLKELTEALGRHVRFSIDRVCEGGGSTVAVLWHLEWNGEHIPFTKGCSFYECSRDDEKLLIKRARIFVESPVKPGEIALIITFSRVDVYAKFSEELLKTISKLFDKFPKVAEKFLQKPNAMILFIIKTYKILVEPFILPFLVYYTHAWSFAAGTLICVVNLLRSLLKLLM